MSFSLFWSKKTPLKVELEGVEPSSKQGTQRFSTYLVLTQLSGKDIAQNKHYSIPYVVKIFAPLHDHSIHYPICVDTPYASNQ